MPSPGRATLIKYISHNHNQNPEATTIRDLCSKVLYFNQSCSVIFALETCATLRRIGNHIYTTRQSDLLYIPRYLSRYAQKLPEYHLSKIWNNWVRSLPQNSSRNNIKQITKSKLLLSYPEHVKCIRIYCIECHRRQ